MKNRITLVFFILLILVTIPWGQLTWISHDIPNFSNRAYSVYDTDVDGDGNMDVLSSPYAYDKVAWNENEGRREQGFYRKNTHDLS